MSNVEARLKRWKIKEIVSRIARLYFKQYMQTSEVYDGVFGFEPKKNGASVG